MILRVVSLLLLLSVFPAWCQFLAGDRLKAVVVPEFDIIFPHIVAGSSWTTRITLVNMESVPARGSLIFTDTQGEELALNFQGQTGAISLLEYEVPGNGAISIETVPGADLQQGYGLLVADPPFGNGRKVSGIAVFRQSVDGRPDFEAAVPLSPITERRFRMPFDNTGGYQTGIALTAFGLDSMGELSLTPTRIEAEYWDESGVRIGSASFHIPGFGQEAFALVTKFPTLSGRRGVIEFRCSKELMAAIGLRFSPGGAFTSLPPSSLLEWHGPPPSSVAGTP